MSNVRFYTFNLVEQDATDITVSSENSFFPKENIKNFHSTKVLRTATGVNTLEVTFDFKTIEAVDSILLAPSSIDGWGFSGSVTVQANPTLDFSSPAFTTTVIPNQKHDLAVKTLSSDETYRFWKLTFSNTGSFVEISKIFIGKSFFLTDNNMDFGWTYASEDRSVIKLNRYAQRFVDEINTQRQIRGQFNLLNKAEFESLIDELIYVGKVKPIWINIDESETIVTEQERFAGRFFQVDVPRVTNRAFSLYNLQIELEEAL